MIHHTHCNALMRIIRAAQYSWNGIIYAYKNEHAFRYEIYTLIMIIASLFILKKDYLTCIIILCSWMIVIALELINSSIEKLCDLFTTDNNPSIKAIKDMASGSVFIAITGNVILWIYTIL